METLKCQPWSQQSVYLQEHDKRRKRRVRWVISESTAKHDEWHYHSSSQFVIFAFLPPLVWSNGDFRLRETPPPCLLVASKCKRPSNNSGSCLVYDITHLCGMVVLLVTPYIAGVYHSCSGIRFENMALPCLGRKVWGWKTCRFNSDCSVWVCFQWLNGMVQLESTFTRFQLLLCK